MDMNPAPKTLIDIARVSRGILDRLVKHGNGKTVESFQLEKIVFVSGAIVETMIKALRLETNALDPRVSDWLAGDEPKTCLDILTRMEGILGSKLGDGGGMTKFFQSPQARHLASQSKCHEAIKLFIKNESYFHFLISMEIWSHGNTSSFQQPLLPEAPQPAPLHIENSVKEYSEQNTEVVETGILAKTTPETKNSINAKKVDKVVRWLNASNTNSKRIHQRMLLLRQEGTCIWLHKTNNYSTWRHAENSFLWLHGKPGAGKSVLAASMINHLSHSLQDDEVLAYFYFDFRNEQSTSASETMRSLLSQLLQKFKSHVRDPENLIEELWELKNEQDSVSARDVASYISRAGKCLHRQPYLVIDALDECNNVGELLDALEELNKGGIRLFVTSRSLQEIKERFHFLSMINMDMMNYETSVDIKLHVTREVDSHRRLRILEKCLKDEIHSMLCKEANGMFRWVQCQLDVIKQCVTATQIREALDDLPSDLDETYERILFKISKDQKQLKVAQRALGWLIVAFRPLKLFQIMEALSIDPVRRVLHRDSAPVHGPALLDVLSSLVAHDELTDIVILSHFSVKEYLTAKSNRARPLACHIDTRDAHTQLVLVCMCSIGIYLEISGDVKKVPLQRRLVRATTTRPDNSGSTFQYIKHPTLQPALSPFHSIIEYAVQCGFHHLGYADPQNKVLHAIEALHLTVQRHHSQWDQLCDAHGEILPTQKHDFVLFILIVFAPESLFRLFLSRSELKVKEGTNPLIYAAYRGKIKHATILLSRGVSLNSRGCHVLNDSRLVFPLEVAAEQGISKIMDLFLANGSLVPQKLFVAALPEWKAYPFPLRIVSRLLKTDEFMEWAIIDDNEERCLRALDPTQYYLSDLVDDEFPREIEFDTIERRLSQLGCDLSVPSDELYLRNAVSTGLVFAVQHIFSLGIPLPHDILLDASHSMASNTEITTLCLKKGADVHVVSSSGDTPFHIALERHRNSAISEDILLENIRALIDAGCNASHCNLAGNIPLHLAVNRGFMSITELLLPLTNPLPPDILLSASEPSMVQLLINKGADVHTIAANGDTPLHRLLLTEFDDSFEPERYLDCVKKLVDAECNPGFPNYNGETPFDIAAKNGHLPVLQYLYGMQSTSLYHNILLSVAGSVMLGNTPIMQFLIRKGADIHVTSPNGDTLLHVVMKEAWQENECLDISRLLVDAGCDPCARNLSGQTLYHAAARRGYASVIEYLFSVGAGPLPKDIMITQFTEKKRMKTIRFLADVGGDVKAVAKNGDTLFHLALKDCEEESDALELSKYLVNLGCAPCTLNSSGKTPLHIAARKGFISVIEYLLSLDMALPHDILLAASNCCPFNAQIIHYLVNQGASVSISTTKKNTPLHLLLAPGIVNAEEDCLGCFRILINAGCNPHAKNLAGDTPLHRAAKHGLSSIMIYLLSLDVLLPPNILLFASSRTTLQFLLDEGLNLSDVKPAGVMHLMCCALRFYEGEDAIEFAEILITAGWDPSRKGSVGKRVIHAAARYSNLDAIKFFLSQNVPLPSDILITASMVRELTSENLISLTSLLIHEGASVRATASNGDTPLHCAIMRRFRDRWARADSPQSWKLVEILLNCGSDPCARNLDGKTPFELAKEKGQIFNDNFLRLVANASMNRPGR